MIFLTLLIKQDTIHSTVKNNPIYIFTNSIVRLNTVFW